MPVEVHSASEQKYSILTRALDEYAREGRTVGIRAKYFRVDTDEETNHSRARAYIHLYLEGAHGISEFEEREKTITDEIADGGIDAYHIDEEEKLVTIVQSKFRTSSANFEAKNIEPSELARMDVDRILQGETCYENGTPYNGRIRAFMEKLGKLNDIARYSYKVVVLANVSKENTQLVTKLFSGYETEVINFERAYQELLLPTLRGEQFYGKNLRLSLDLSNKPQSPKLSATIPTKAGNAELTVVLIPTVEIAKLMNRYKNSILRYNPRSYLDFSNQTTNHDIRSSISDKNSGEFALLNNGITILSDDTFFSEKIGQANAGKVEIVNPQIINGGQTAFTLGRVYEAASDIERDSIFEGKEVILRIITLPKVETKLKNELILRISTATNTQTQVTNADRAAFNNANRALAGRFFARTGLLFEPKQGEFADARHRGILRKYDIVDRGEFVRLYLITIGRFPRSYQKNAVATELPKLAEDLSDDRLDLIRLLHDLNERTPVKLPPFPDHVRGRKSADRPRRFGRVLFASKLCGRLSSRLENYEDRLGVSLRLADELEPALVEWCKEEFPKYYSRKPGEPERFRYSSWARSGDYDPGITKFTDSLDLDDLLLTST